MKQYAFTKHGQFAVDSRDLFVGRKLLTHGEYSEEELELLKTCMHPSADVLVVGAHIGALAIPMSRHCRQLIAIEANPDTYALLEENIRLNACGNIRSVFGAANDTGGGHLELLCGVVNSGGSKRTPLKERPDYVMDNPARVLVPTLRLDDVCDEGPFSLIHMDIEGSEPFALRGAQRLLSVTQYLSVEFIGHHLTHVAGVTVEEWLAPIRPHFNNMLVPGCARDRRPHVFLHEDDWQEMLQSIVDAGAGIEHIIFWREG